MSTPPPPSADPWVRRYLTARFRGAAEVLV
jgi:hypothetical protein